MKAREFLQKQGVAEGKITLSTDPNWYGAEVGDYKASSPVVNIPSNCLVGFEPDDKMNQPKSKANVEKIVAGLNQGAKLPPLLVRKYKNGYQVLDGHHRFWAYKMLGVKSIPAQIVPDSDIEEKGQQGVTEGTEQSQSLSSMASQDQSERYEYENFVKSQAGGDWSCGAKMYAQLKKRPRNDIFGDTARLNQFMKIKFDFDKFTKKDWENYWLLAQHCDKDRNFQKNALSIIKKYQGTDHKNYKYLYDRISMGLTGKQKYGTQNELAEQGVAKNSLNEFAGSPPGGDDGEEFEPWIATLAHDDGLSKGVALSNHMTLVRAMMIHNWHTLNGGMYIPYFADGFKKGRMNKVNHDNTQYNLNLKLMKDGSIRDDSEQGVTEGLGPDTQRLEQEVRDALANGDDHTAKSFAKMARTAADRNYLRKIIRQEMYGTGPGQGGVAEGDVVQGQVRQTLNAWMNQDQQYKDPTQRKRFQAKVWPYIQQNINAILSDKGKDRLGGYPAAPYAAWLLVQHMDAYPQNQLTFLNWLEKSGLNPDGKLQFLKDRAAVNQWIAANANKPEYFINGKPLPNPTVNVRNPAMFKDAGIVATSREEALQNAQAAGNKLLVAAVQATNAQTQPSYKQGVAEGEVVPFVKKKKVFSFTKNQIIQLKALCQTALELSWENHLMPTAYQGPISKLSPQEQKQIFDKNEAQIQSLGYNYLPDYTNRNTLFLHSIERAAWWDDDKPPEDYYGPPDLKYDAETNTLSYYNSIRDKDYEYTDSTQFESLREEEVTEGVLNEFVAYHGTFRPRLQRFFRLSHFGTERSATDRLHHVKSERPDRPDKAYIYELDLGITAPGTVKDHPDMVDPGPGSMEKIAAWSRDLLKDPRFANYTGENPINGQPNWNGKDILKHFISVAQGRYWREWHSPKTFIEMWINFLQAVGIDGLVYFNQVEHRRSKSYVIFHPDQVRVLGKPKVIDLSKKDQPQSKVKKVSVYKTPMIKSSEEITESLNKPYPMKWSRSEFGSRGEIGDWEVLAKLPDGTNLEILFSTMSNLNNSPIELIFLRGDTMELTGEGDAQRVFATVLAAIQQFIKKAQPETLIFSASKEVEPGQSSQSRFKLYDRLVQRYANAWGYESHQEDYSDHVKYRLTKKESVKESRNWQSSMFTTLTWSRK